MENIWKGIPTRAPFILEEDLFVIQEMNYLYRGSAKEIQTQLLPEPFVGNINAPIIILTKNTGFDKGDDPIWHAKERFQRLALSNLYQEPSDYPLYFLHPEIKDSPGAIWHYGKMKELIRRTSLTRVADNVCSIPYFPYHTSRFSVIPKKISKEGLSSHRYTKLLIRNAIDRRAIIIMASGRRAWASLVPELDNYQKKYLLRSAQCHCITPGNLDQFEELVDALV